MSAHVLTLGAVQWSEFPVPLGYPYLAGEWFRGDSGKVFGNYRPKCLPRDKVPPWAKAAIDDAIAASKFGERLSRLRREAQAIQEKVERTTGMHVLCPEAWQFAWNFYMTCEREVPHALVLAFWFYVTCGGEEQSPHDFVPEYLADGKASTVSPSGWRASITPTWMNGPLDAYGDPTTLGVLTIDMRHANEEDVVQAFQFLASRGAAAGRPTGRPATGSRRALRGLSDVILAIHEDRRPEYVTEALWPAVLEAWRSWKGKGTATKNLVAAIQAYVEHRYKAPISAATVGAVCRHAWKGGFHILLNPTVEE